MALVQITADPPLEAVDKTLATYARVLQDLRPYWELLGRDLADDTQRRWPLRRRSGRLRRSLTFAGSRLGRSGIYRSRPDRLVFGTRIFYGAFSQKGTKHQPKRELIHVDPGDIAQRLGAWATERAVRAGLEATP